MGAHRPGAGLSPIRVDPALEFPLTLRSRIVKERSRLQAFEEPGEPNAQTLIEPLGDGLYPFQVSEIAGGGRPLESPTLVDTSAG